MPPALEHWTQIDAPGRFPVAGRSDPWSWTTVSLPERELADVLWELASPLLAKLGAAPDIEEERRVLGLVIAFWNASVQASKRWDRPRLKELKELKRRLRGSQALPAGVEVFDVLTERWRDHWLDPRLVERWRYDADEAGARQLSCKFCLPENVRAEAPPPTAKRVAIGGRFLDEVRIRRADGANSFSSFPVERHGGVVGDDGGITVRTMMPTALQLFAEGRLSRIGGGPVEVQMGAREPTPMLLTEVHCGGERNDLVVLVFKPALSGSL